MIERRYLLLYTYKIFIYVSIAALIYIFTVGLFTTNDSPQQASQTFSLASLENDSHMYIDINGRELLVINTNNKVSAYWANDPIYGCRLELKESIIKPVCIDIEYNLNGYDKKTDQQLKSPDYSTNTNHELIIYD